MQNVVILTFFSLLLGYALSYISRHSSQPVVFFIMQIFHRDFVKFIQTQNSIQRFCGKAQNKGAEKPNGHRDTPHIDGVAPHPKFCIASGAKNTRDNRCIDALSYDVIRRNQGMFQN